MTDETNLPDEVLERALSIHGRCEPLAGLEERVLARLAERPTRPSWQAAFPRRRLAWAALAATAFLFLSIALLPRYRPSPGKRVALVRAPGAGPSATVPPVPRPPLAREAGPVPPPATARIRKTSTPRVPRGTEFPRPVPLGDQEKLLLAYVSRTPPDELEPRSGFLNAPAPLPPLPPDQTTP